MLPIISGRLSSTRETRVSLYLILNEFKDNLNPYELGKLLHSHGLDRLMKISKTFVKEKLELFVALPRCAFIHEIWVGPPTNAHFITTKKTAAELISDQ